MSGSNQSRNTCAICGGVLGRTLYVHDVPDRFERHVGITEEQYRREWLECESCGSATNRHDLGNEARLSELASGYYEVDFAGSSIADKFNKVMFLPPGKSDNAERVERIISTISRVQACLPGATGRRFKVMDVGAGTGVFLARFLSVTSDQGDRWEAVGIEPDPNAAEHLSSLDRFDVVQSLFVGQPELTGFDLVTLNKVVEHVAEPVPFVKLVARALEPDRGVVYVEVPDVLTIGRRPGSDNILGALHYHLYSPFGLTRLFDMAGLQILEFGRVFEPSGKLTVYGFACRTQLLDAMAVTYQ